MLEISTVESPEIFYLFRFLCSSSSLADINKFVIIVQYFLQSFFRLRLYNNWLTWHHGIKMYALYIIFSIIKSMDNLKCKIKFYFDKSRSER